jgi:hypothetical protein
MSTDARRRFYAFVREAARRYGPNGYFWADKDVVQANRPKWFQVWNEPNIPNYWNHHPDPEGYGRFLRQTATVLKAADPDVRVLAAGLPEPSTFRPGYYHAADFMQRMLAVPGVNDVVDGVAVHPYATYPRQIFDHLDRARTAMRRSGASSKSLFITEFGWATGGGNRGLSTTPAGQAERLRNAYRLLLSRRTEYRLAGAYWFSYKDTPVRPGGYDWWGRYTGLVDRYRRPKPSWGQFALVARGEP